MKIDVSPVIGAHLQTLRDARFGGAKLSVVDITTFFAVPVCVGVGLAAWGFRFRVDAVNGLLTAFSILTGLLLNLLVLVFTLASAAPPLNMEPRKRKVMLTEIFANVCFSLLVAISVVCVAVVALSYMRSMPGASTGRITTALIGALTINFVFTILMVIKRMFILLRNEMNEGRMSRAA